MPRSKPTTQGQGRPVTAALVVAALTFLGASPAPPPRTRAVAPRPYHLQLEAQPGAPFPWLSKFGTVDIDLYPGGVHFSSLGLRAFSVNGSPGLTALNPIARMYTEIPITEIASIMSKLGSTAESQGGEPPTVAAPVAGKVGALRAARYRLWYGPAAWIDIWTTSEIPENRQYRALVDRFVSAVSAPTAKAARTIPGTPVYVELNFRRFKKVQLLHLKQATFDNSGEADALQVGSFYMKAPFLDAIWK